MQTLLVLFVVSGASTLLGSLPVVWHRYLKEAHWHWLDSFGGGVMTGAALFSLYLPAYRLLVQFNDSLFTIVWASALGFGFIFLISWWLGRHVKNTAKHHAFLIVLVMAVHNIPEGMAVGVNLAGLGLSAAWPLNVAIFIQNLPEGFVSSMSFLIAGFGIRAALMANGVTAVVEVAAAILGYIYASHSASNLPFLLSFAAASMMSVVALENYRHFRRGEGPNFSWSGFITGLLLTASLDLLL